MTLDGDGGDPPCWAHLLDDVDRPPIDTAWSAAYELLADAVVVTDRAGTIRLWNSAAATLFGWSADQAIGQSLDLIIPAPYRDRHWRGYARVMSAGKTGVRGLQQTPALRSDGEQISIAFTVSLIVDGDTALGIVTVVRDETGRRAELARGALKDALEINTRLERVRR